MVLDINSSKILIDGMIFPPILCWALCVNVDKIYIDSASIYRKKSFRNRYYIVSSQGLLHLSIPLLKGKNNQQPLHKVKIDNQQNWQLNHKKSIQSVYGKTPFFIHYKDLIDEILFTPVELLIDLQVKAFSELSAILGYSAEINLHNVWTELSQLDFFDARNLFNLSNRFENDLFPIYHQVHSHQSGFIPNASILDMLFHLGPESFANLKKLKDNAIELSKTKQLIKK